MKARHAVLVALVAAVTLTSVAAAGPDAAKQRVAISMKKPGERHVRAHAAAARDAQARLGHGEPRLQRAHHRDARGAAVYIYRNTYTLKGKRGTMSIRERNEFVEVSNEKVPGYDFTPGVGIGTWKVVGGTGAYAKITGGGRSGHAGPPLARAPRGLPH